MHRGSDSRAESGFDQHLGPRKRHNIASYFIIDRYHLILADS